MIKRKFFTLIVSSAFLFIGKVEASDTLKILFVGNSFTYFWNVPQVLSSMAESNGLLYQCRKSTLGGSNWEEHWKGERGLETVNKILKGTWDYVVLQNHSSSTIDRSKQFRKYGGKFIELIRSVGAKPILYTTWSYSSDSSMQSAITKGYQDLANQYQIEVVPVGPVWGRVRASYPDLNLYHDNKHQSPLGAYLIALTFFKKLSGKSVGEVPRRLPMRDRDDEILHLLFIKESEAQKVKAIIESMDF